ncbi:MAG: SRPBCC family protein [Syntrophomonadaceae bacterium]
MNISVNKGAPVFSSSEITITASLDCVWETLSEISEWPIWQSSVTEVKLEGLLNEASEFTWKADGITFKSKIHTMKPKIMFGWTGKTTGAYAIHNWTLSEQDNEIIVRVEESLEGVLPTLFRNYFQKSLDKGMLRNLKELKLASELKEDH